MTRYTVPRRSQKVPNDQAATVQLLLMLLQASIKDCSAGAQKLDELGLKIMIN